jgi:hypothetical protein
MVNMQLEHTAYHLHDEFTKTVLSFYPNRAEIYLATARLLLHKVCVPFLSNIHLDSILKSEQNRLKLDFSRLFLT